MQDDPVWFESGEGVPVHQLSDNQVLNAIAELAARLRFSPFHFPKNKNGEGASDRLRQLAATFNAGQERRRREWLVVLKAEMRRRKLQWPWA